MKDRRRAVKGLTKPVAGKVAHHGKPVAFCKLLDGMTDVAISHLYEPYSLLINHTTEAGKGIVLNLRSTTGHRDGIGASATVTLGDRQITAQLTAGDGYMCSSERKLFIGTGNSIQVENYLSFHIGVVHVLQL